MNTACGMGPNWGRATTTPMAHETRRFIRLQGRSAWNKTRYTKTVLRQRAARRGTGAGSATSSDETEAKGEDGKDGGTGTRGRRGGGRMSAHLQPQTEEGRGAEGGAVVKAAVRRQQRLRGHQRRAAGVGQRLEQQQQQQHWVAGEAQYTPPAEARRLGQQEEMVGQQGTAAAAAAAAAPEEGSSSPEAEACRRLQQRLASAVQAEEQGQQQAVLQLYSSRSLRSLQIEGAVLAGCQLRCVGEQYGDFTYQLQAASGKLPFHRFSQGDTVLLSAWHGCGGEQRHADMPAVDAVVLQASREYVKIVVEAALQQQVEAVPQGAWWRLDKSMRDATSRRQLTAIRQMHVLRDKHNDGERRLRRILLGHPQGAELALEPTVWCRDSGWRADVKARLAGMTGTLNPSQMRAIARSIAQTFTLWQGPPGTGKTRTLLALLEVLCHASGRTSQRWHRMGTVLACAGTNAAVDNLVEGLAASSIQVVRVGQPAKVRESLRHLTLNALAEASEEGKQALQLRQMARGMELQVQQGGPRWQLLSRIQRDELQLRARQARQRADALIRAAGQAVLDRAEVVATTCAGAGDEATLAERGFRVVVVDECTQTTEAATLIPLVRGAECVVLAGDPKQLPPTVISSQALQLGLDVTLFDRMQRAGHEPLLLDTQYRMAPMINDFPSRWFYQGRLQSGIRAEQRPLPAGMPWPNAQVPVALVEVPQGAEQRSQPGGALEPAVLGGAAKDGRAGDGSSFRNAEEAAVVVQLLRLLLQQRRVCSVAILTPYRAQLRLLEQSVTASCPVLPAEVDLAISTVDGFQGREAEVVIFSTVRCNSQGKLGFVADWRRLNVALTRPRNGLVVVGCPETLQRGSHDWKRWLDWVTKYNVSMAADQLPVPSAWDPHPPEAPPSQPSLHGVPPSNGSRDEPDHRERPDV